MCWLLHECSLWNKREAVVQSGEWGLVCVGYFMSAAFGTKEKRLHSQVSGDWCVLVVSRVQPLEQKGAATAQSCEWEWHYVGCFTGTALGTKRRDAQSGTVSGNWGAVSVPS